MTVETPDIAGQFRSHLRGADFATWLRWYIEFTTMVERGAIPGTLLAELCKDDRYLLLVGVLNQTHALHPWVYERCREVEAEPDGCLDLWARGHMKTSLITFAGSIQEIIRNPEITIGIFGNDRPVAKGFLRQIKAEMEMNDKLPTYWPDIFWKQPKRESPKWSEDEGLVVKRKGNPREATISAWGLVDAQPTGRHFGLRIYDDAVTEDSVTTPEMILKTTERWELSQNLARTETAGQSGQNRMWHVGTRYCLVGLTRILMSDFSHRPIQDVKIGDEVVGWEKRDGKRYLKKAKVVAAGMYEKQPTVRYRFSNGRTVCCTADHKWWRGPHGGGPEYRPLEVSKNKESISIRELLAPLRPLQDVDAGWLAGMFDGEGTIRKNTNHPSGVISLAQSERHPEIIEKIRRVLNKFYFEFSENITGPANDRCAVRHNFFINGGWRERYRFLAEIQPERRDRMIETLYAQLQTQEHRVEQKEDIGNWDVYWIETETGNYIAEGFCSSNSYGDTYGVILKRGALKPRIYPATDDGTFDGKPVLLTQAAWDQKKLNESRGTIATQQLLNPIAGELQKFRMEWVQRWETRPERMNVGITVDPANSRTKGACNTAMIVQGVAPGGNWYFLDGFCHQMSLKDRWEALLGLWLKWSRMPGVLLCMVGYEKYGMQADIDYFQLEMDRMPRDRKVSIPITEVNWVSDGSNAKDDRIERLTPLFQKQQYFFPYEGQKTKRMLEQEERGNHHLVAKPVMRKNEQGKLYNVVQYILDNEYLFFPATAHKDGLDAMSRLFDLDITAPAPPMRPEQLIPLHSGEL